MTRTAWIALAIFGAPTLFAAFLVSSIFGPLGALAFCGLLLGGVNARYLFREHRQDAHTSPIQIIRERLHR